MITKITGIYAIADSKWSPFSSLANLVEKFLDGGCRLVQLRVKPNSDSPADLTHAKNRMLEEAQAAMLLKKRYNFTLIINDHADIAFQVGADGVHIGKNDARISDIKQKYSDKLIVGYSSHSIEEAIEAEKNGADYVAFGAIFPTKTKGPGHPVQGLEKLKTLAAQLKVPLVAIGGIDRKNIKDIFQAGASSAAMISALTSVGDVTGEVKYFTNTVVRLASCVLRS